MQKIGIWIVILALAIAACTPMDHDNMMDNDHVAGDENPDHDFDDAMLEHCKQMPGMAGCDELVNGHDEEYMTDNHAHDDAMLTHCEQMPGMSGCEDILSAHEGEHKEDHGHDGLEPCSEEPGTTCHHDVSFADTLLESFENGFLPELGATLATAPQLVDLAEGDTYQLTASIVQRNLNGQLVPGYAYNGMIPGPVLRVEKESTITVTFTNNIDQDTTVHWHGLRHANKDDGVPGVTQPPVKPGESYEYTVYFPDAGLYWYHPHIREDSQQGLGLAGTMLVKDGAVPVNAEHVLVLSDILLGTEGLVPFGEEHATHALMGRFGNLLLVNGQPEYNLTAKKGDVLRLYLANTANARPFNFSIGAAQLKLVGGDLGLYEQEEFVDSIIIAPAQRYIVDVYFEFEGEYPMLNKNPEKTYSLGVIKVGAETSTDVYESDFTTLHSTSRLFSTETLDAYLAQEPDYDLELTLDMTGMMMGDMDHDMDSMLGSSAGIEWEDDMGMMNAQSTSETVTWIIKDKATGKQNMDVSIIADVGDVMKIRLENIPDSMHPMQHPIHIHGQRFAVIAVDGVAVDNLVWQDTVLVETGNVVDIMVDVTNPGTWMMHCHIAEHLEAGMMVEFIANE
ncbi:MAG: suppressor of ftsI [Candidatus Woesearchaeota archaeon]|jgi:suppressor of ftsI